MPLCDEVECSVETARWGMRMAMAGSCLGSCRDGRAAADLKPALKTAGAARVAARLTYIAPGRQRKGRERRKVEKGDAKSDKKVDMGRGVN